MLKYFMLLPIMLLFFSRPVKAQSAEIQQLILNIQKLNQLRSILDNMYKGYTILSNGYNTVKNLAEGNFKLHEIFLDKLMQVSPTVKKYHRIVEIISMQKQLVQEYKSARHNFREANVFSAGDLDYLQSVYDNLVDRSLKNLDELLMVVTSGQLRMNDAERLDAIDRIFEDMQDKFNFLRYFNNKTTLLAAQKKKTLQETKDIMKLFGTEE